MFGGPVEVLKPSYFLRRVVELEKLYGIEGELMHLVETMPAELIQLEFSIKIAEVIADRAVLK